VSIFRKFADWWSGKRSRVRDLLAELPDPTRILAEANAWHSALTLLGNRIKDWEPDDTRVAQFIRENAQLVEFATGAVRGLGAERQAPLGPAHRIEGDARASLGTGAALVEARGDGGFGGPAEGAPEPHKVPERAPDMSVDFTTREDQALLYRLNGDRNPLHSDPESAKRSGFPRPILHGLCTYGITCRAILQAVTDFDPDQIKSHQARFSAPVFPGDTITVDIWKDGKEISFEARVKSRNATVIKNGLAVLR